MESVNVNPEVVEDSVLTALPSHGGTCQGTDHFPKWGTSCIRCRVIIALRNVLWIRMTDRSRMGMGIGSLNSTSSDEGAGTQHGVSDDQRPGVEAPSPAAMHMPPPVGESWSTEDWLAALDAVVVQRDALQAERDRERDRAEAAEVNLGRERKAWGAAEHKISSLKHRLMSLEDAARRVRHGDHDYDLDVIRTDCILCAAIEGRYQPAWMEEPFEFLNDPIVKTPTPHLESASGLGYPRPPVVLPPADLVSWPWRLWRRQ